MSKTKDYFLCTECDVEYRSIDVLPRYSAAVCRVCGAHADIGIATNCTEFSFCHGCYDEFYYNDASYQVYLDLLKPITREELGEFGVPRGAGSPASTQWK